MTVHLIKMAVGVESVRHLADVQKRRLQQARQRNGEAKLCHITRNTPRRSAALLDGGSLYWVIKGFIRVRQLVQDLEPVTDRDGRRACALILDPHLVPIEPRPFRAFQGWRYLAPADAPLDVSDSIGDKDTIPTEMAAELRALGLL